MAELPGWDRSRLQTAATADVEAARIVVYARRLEPIVSEPLAAQLEVLDIDSIKDPKRRARKVESHQKKRRGLLLRAQDTQNAYRRLLELDEPDEPDDEDPDVDEALA